MQRACDVCRTQFEAKRPSARYCGETCKKRAQRTGKAGPSSSVAAAGLVSLPSPEQPPATAGELVTSTEQALRDAGRIDTWLGQSAVQLARRIEQSMADTGSAYASLHRELRAAMTEALKGANVAKSAVQLRRDELAARRATRRAQ